MARERRKDERSLQGSTDRLEPDTKSYREGPDDESIVDHDSRANSRTAILQSPQMVESRPASGVCMNEGD